MTTAVKMRGDAEKGIPAGRQAGEDKQRAAGRQAGEDKRRAAGKWGGREAYLDVLRVLATAAVVLMHAVSGVLGGEYDFTGYERRVKAFRALVDATSWCVPIFLMISGYLFLNPAKKITWKDALFKYCRRILLALILFGIPFTFLEIYKYVGHFEWWMVRHTLVYTATGRSWSHMWYLYLIFILYALTPGIKWLLSKAKTWMIWGVLVLLAFGGSFLPFAEALMGAAKIIAIPVQGVYVFYYLMGYVFSVRRKEGGKGEGGICLVAFFLLLILQMGSRFLEGYELDMAYAYPPTLLSAILLFDGAWALSRREWRKKDEQKEMAGIQVSDAGKEKVDRKGTGERNPEEGMQKADAGMGRASQGTSRLGQWAVAFSPLCFGIYLMHPVFLNLFYKFLKISIMNFRFYVGVPLFFCIAFFGAAAATWIARLIPPLRKYVL